MHVGPETVRKIQVPLSGSRPGRKQTNLKDRRHYRRPDRIASVEDAELRVQLHPQADIVKGMDSDHVIAVRGQRRKKHRRPIYPTDANA